METIMASRVATAETRKLKKISRISNVKWPIHPVYRYLAFTRQAPLLAMEDLLLTAICVACGANNH